MSHKRKARKSRRKNPAASIRHAEANASDDSTIGLVLGAGALALVVFAAMKMK